MPKGVAKSIVPRGRKRCLHKGCARRGFTGKSIYYCPLHKRDSRPLKEKDRYLLSLLEKS